MSIIRFNKFNESKSSTHLKDLNYFKQFFQDMIDDEYKIILGDIQYKKNIPQNDDTPLIAQVKFSQFPKEGYNPYYTLYLNKETEKYINSIEDLTSFNNYCKVFQECLNGLINDLEMDVKLHEVSINSFSSPRFTLNFCDEKDVPEDEIHDDTLSDFYEMVEGILSRLGYSSKVKLKKDDEEQTLTLTCNLVSSQIKALSARLDENNNLDNRKFEYKTTWKFNYMIESKFISDRKFYKVVIKNIVMIPNIHNAT